MLNQIKEALENAFDIPVYYGSSLKASGKRIFDYIVFWREKTTWKVNSKGDYTDYYTVALVRQDYIPEDEKTAILDVLRNLPGLKENGDIEYDYLTQPDTKLALEVARYHFIAARKRLPAKEIEDEQSD